MTRIAILETGRTRMHEVVVARGGGYSRWFADALEPLGVEWTAYDTVAGALPDPAEHDGFIVTGSPASVHDRAPWSEALAAWLRAATEQGHAILGVCYGHQLLAHALGGSTGPNPRGPSVGTFAVQLLDEDPLFAGMSRPLRAHFVHYNAVTALPPQARLLARSERCDVQAFAIGDRVRAVQWHPEFDAMGVRVAIAQDAETLRAAGQDPVALSAAVVALPERERVLQNFVQGIVSPISAP